MSTDLPFRRRRPGNESICSFKNKATTIFVLVSVSWGLFVYGRIYGGNAAGRISSVSFDVQASDSTSTKGLQAGEAPKAVAAAQKAQGAALQSGASSEWTWNEVPRDDRYYLAFSTDCSGYQNWQSLALVFSADEVRQPGTIVRIASGCTEVRLFLHDTLWLCYPKAPCINGPVALYYVHTEPKGGPPGDVRQAQPPVQDPLHA